MFLVYAALAVLGAALFFAGTGLVAHEKVYDDQVPGINIAIAGVVIANAAGVLLLMAGRRSVTARRLKVLGAVPPVGERSAVIAALATSAALVGGEGLTHFHRADCVMATGRDWPSLDRATHENAGRRPCGVCKP
jgi:hypothetical protein